MYQLTGLFLLIQLTLFARYIVYDAFHLQTYLSTFLLPLAAVGLYILGKWGMKNEQSYTPTNEVGWSFYHRQKVFLNQKKLYWGTEEKGYIQRYHEKKWLYIISDLFNVNFFTEIKVQISEDLFEFKPNKKKLFSKQDYWTVYKNKVEIGTAKTVFNMNNTRNFKEVLEFQIGEDLYTTKASTLTSKITLFKEEVEIGSYQNATLFKNVNEIHLSLEQFEQLPYIVLHAFRLKNL